MDEVTQKAKKVAQSTRYIQEVGTSFDCTEKHDENRDGEGNASCFYGERAC
jgi:hypothetical protein